jgi:8-oxo-dGTP pyrophosphatase MutT (NUDIX family)
MRIADGRQAARDSRIPDRQPVPRPSARVVLLDGAGRLLLFSANSGLNGPVRWFTAGGGVEEGETYEQAAVRELREETGLTGVVLGPEVWRGRPWTTVRNGVLYEVRQRYYLVRVPAFEIDTSAFEDEERSAIIGYHWWTREELAVTTDVLRPAGLPGLLAALIADGPPREPITVDG